MKAYKTGLILISFALLLSNAPHRALAQAAPPEPTLANVEGNWAIYSKDWDGKTATKSVQLKQNGNQLTGHFKGPNQSGGVEGSINEQHLVVRTKTRDVLTFRGRVDGPRVEGVVQGNAYDGTFHDRGGTGSFQAVRSN